MRYSKIKRSKKTKLVNCLVCNKEFYVYKDIITAKFCSRACKTQNQKGKFIPQFPSRLGLSSPRKGIKCSDVLKKKMSDAHKLGGKFKKGKDSPFWKDGRSSNKDYVVWSSNNWLRRKKAATGSHTWNEWETLKAQYNWICPSCKKRELEIKLSQDHIIPLSKGGSDNIENIQPLCMPCNLRKQTKIIRY